MNFQLVIATIWRVWGIPSSKFNIIDSISIWYDLGNAMY